MTSPPGFPLADQWSGAPFITPAQMAARIDAQMNVLGGFMSNFPSNGVDYELVSGLSVAANVAQGANVIFNAVGSNGGGGFSATTGVYTIPLGGLWCWYISTAWATASQQVGVEGVPGASMPSAWGDTMDANAGFDTDSSGWGAFAGGESFRLVKLSAGTVSCVAGTIYMRRIGG